MRILVVEDDKDLNRQLEASLLEAGYVVDKAFDGEEGHFLGDTEPYDAVILDVMLPEMNGFEFLEAFNLLDPKYTNDFQIVIAMLSNHLIDKDIFMTKDASALNFQYILTQLVPDRKFKWIGRKGRINFSTVWKAPLPEIFILNILHHPRNRLPMNPLPGQYSAALLHIKMHIRQISERGLGRHMMV